jgi:hypothetical protein
MVVRPADDRRRVVRSRHSAAADGVVFARSAVGLEVLVVVLLAVLEARRRVARHHILAVVYTNISLSDRAKDSTAYMGGVS